MCAYFSANMAVVENEPLSRHSSMRTGGNARYAAFPANRGELLVLINEADRVGLRYAVIGNGTNVLFDDSGFDGIIIFTSKMRNISWNNTTVTADAGVPLGAIAADAASRGLSGMESLCGIPATLGGAVYMNAGAAGHSISDILTESTSLVDGEIVTKTLAEHAFGYRKSVFQRGGAVILSATLSLTPDAPDVIRERMALHLQKRKDTQPLEYPSAGSIFKRPAGAYAGELIEKAGLKGYTLGGAAVSEKHAGFIVNRGGATTNDVRALMDIIVEKVYRMSNIRLEAEVIFIR